MNNNMPNNAGNGMPGGNPMDAANAQLMGGQSTVGAGTSSVMQGVGNVQNPGGVMQGVNDVSNAPGVMQGVPSPAGPTSPVMPGQGHSGVDAVTMQAVEPVKEDTGVVDIPNFAAPQPEAPKVDEVAIPNPAGNMMGAPAPNPSVGTDMVTPPMPNPLSTPAQPEVGPMPVPPVNNTIGGPVNPGPSPIGPMGNPGPVNTIGDINSNPEPSPVMQGPMPGNSNNIIGSPEPAANTIGDVEPAPAQNTLGDNDVAEMSDVPEKKFPLSVREMVLVAVALIGIVVVVIMYWG